MVQEVVLGTAFYAKWGENSVPLRKAVGTATEGNKPQPARIGVFAKDEYYDRDYPR